MTEKPIFWPAVAYVPGKTARPAEGAFDTIRETALAGMSPLDLAQSEAMRHGYAYLEAGYFWEAHEVLEAVWIALPQGSPERRFVQGVIQVANGRLKVRMDRPNAAKRLHAMAAVLLEAGPVAPNPAFQLQRAETALAELGEAINVQYNAK
jgi:hypothetical protein